MRESQYEYVSARQRKAKAEKSAQKLKKKKPDLAPVVITGRNIATTWWGKAWTKNLEIYADYENRIARGRSYVRSGAVLDLQIDTGVVRALVQGSRAKPYKIEIRIAALSKANWEKVLGVCGHQIDGLSELIEGKFPQQLETLFTAKGSGLFPSPPEIDFGCSCPDWASMCKHVAAALYGVGARFDEDPTLFFKLRDIDFEALLKKTIDQKINSLLENAGRKTPRVMDDADIADLFGI